jgi:hypothetical protein
MSKKKTLICSLFIVLFFYMILSCENPMVKSILPDAKGNSNTYGKE